MLYLEIFASCLRRLYISGTRRYFRVQAEAVPHVTLCVAHLARPSH